MSGKKQEQKQKPLIKKPAPSIDKRSPSGQTEHKN